MKRGRIIGASACSALAAAALGQPCTPVWADTFENVDFVDAIGALRQHDDGSGPALYVGCKQRVINGTIVKGLVRWNGRQWSGIGGSLANGSSDPWVRLLVPFPDGAGTSLLVSGEFDSAGGVPVLGVAKWNGSTWAPMDANFFGGMSAATVMDRGTGPFLYGAAPWLGGFGDHAIARWTGSAWSPIGYASPSTAFPGYARVAAMCVYDSGSGPQLFAGGSIGFIGSTVINGVARWNGTSWAAAGALGGSYVSTMTLHNDGSVNALYVGGAFGTVAGVTTPGVARWNGSAWSRVGTEFTAGTEINTLKSFDADGPGPLPPLLYAGGRIVSAGPLNDARIAAWNGTAWTALGAGVATTMIQAPDVYSLENSDVSGRPSLYVGGFMHRAGALNVNHLAAWDGADWTPMSQPVSGPVRASTTFQGRTFIGGQFTTAGQRAVTSLAQWDDGWKAVGAPLAGIFPANLVVNDLLPFDDGSGEALYVAGNFTLAGALPTKGVARWSGSAWSAVETGGPAFLYVTDLAVIPDGATPRLHALGRLTTSAANRTDLAKLVNGQWVPVGPTLTFNANSVVGFDGGTGFTYYVGGATTSPTSILSRLNGAAWSNITTTGTSIQRLFVYEDGAGLSLLVAGKLTAVTGVPVSNIARLRQNTWTAMGSLPGMTVAALTMFDDGTGATLRAGGTFQPTSGPTIARTLHWDGQAWQRDADLSGTSASGGVLSLGAGRHAGRPALIVGGTLSNVGTVGTSNIAMHLACDPPCYANCDLSTAQPILNVTDFICYLNRFAAVETYANCDGSTAPPVLNVADFICFLNRYAAGCP